jgi:Ala-tRNA(Pro) deacylase
MVSQRNCRCNKPNFFRFDTGASADFAESLGPSCYRNEEEIIMPIPTNISTYLDSQHVSYQSNRHSPAYTAQGIAQAQHFSGKKLAKVVMAIADQDKLVMAVVPANCRVDFDRFAKLLNARIVKLAMEDEFKDVFPDCELGAMPPLGNLYHIDVWIDDVLKLNNDICFNAGTHAETILMAFSDFHRLVQPRAGSFGVLLH